MTDIQQKTPYSMMGGEKSILSLVDRFYFYMDTLAEATELRAIHAADLSVTKENCSNFYLAG